VIGRPHCGVALLLIAAIREIGVLRFPAGCAYNVAMHIRLCPTLLLALCCAACAPAATPPLPSPSLASTLPASTAPATAPPSPAATAYSTATLAPAPIHFTEPFDSAPPHWVFVQADNGQAIAAPSVRDGFLVFDLAAPNDWGYALYDLHSYGNALVEAQAQNRTAGDGSAGLVCDYNESSGWYEFNIFQDRTYQLLFGQWLAKGIVRYTPLYQGESDAIHDDANVIGLECQGSMLTPSVNGVALRKWPEQRFGLESGRIGLAAASFSEAPFSVAFDWVKVSGP